MTTAVGGLTAAEVAERVAHGQVNDVPEAPTRTLAEIVRAIDGTGTGITSMEVHEPNLEAVFLHLTGKALRDEE